MPSSVVLSAVPFALILTNAGTVNAQPVKSSAVSRADQDQGDQFVPDQPEQWPSAVAPNVHTYRGAHIPDDTLSSLQWARPIPDEKYLAPLGPLTAPVQVAPVPPIAPRPGKLRFGDLQVDSPGWLGREQAIQLNDGAAETEAGLATFLDSIGMERSRSDRVAGETVAGAVTGATAGAVAASPFGVIGGVAGGALGAVIGIPFAPIGLVAVPIGAAYGLALMEVPIAALGAGVGATLGAADALSAPPRALHD